MKVVSGARQTIRVVKGGRRALRMVNRGRRVMSVVDGGRRTMQAVAAAGEAAPFVRSLVSDDDVRNGLRTLVRTANHLYGELSEDDRMRKILTDATVRRDVDRLMGATQQVGRAVIPRRRRVWPYVVVAAGGSAAFVYLFRPARDSVANLSREVGDRASSQARVVTGRFDALRSREGQEDDPTGAPTPETTTSNTAFEAA